MLAWLPSRPTAVSVHCPLTASRPRTVSPRSVKKAIVASRSRTAIPTFSSLMGMRCTLSSQARFARVGWLPVPARPVQGPFRRVQPPVLGLPLVPCPERVPRDQRLARQMLDESAGGGVTQPLTRRNDAGGADHPGAAWATVRPARLRLGRTLRRSRHRRRSRSSRSPPAAAGSRRPRPPGHPGVWPASPPRAAQPGRCPARTP